jgi:transcriptional regulator with XRE-family HTH domain
MNEDPDISPELGRRLASLRHKCGLTQQALADASGLTVEAISRIERATREPRISTLVRIASGLGVSLSHMFDLEDGPTNRPHPSLREDVEELAGYLNDKPLVQVKVVARLARVIVENADS